MERYDIAIIGSGPAGVSAAITATIRNKRVLLLGEENLSAKLRSAALIRNYPGLPDVSGNELADTFRRQLDTLGITVTPQKVFMVYSMGNSFSIQTGADMVESTAVIIATGVNAGKTFPGETDYLGRGVSYCATCDAPLCRGHRVLVLGYDAESISEANFLAEIASEVTYIPVKGGTDGLKDNVHVVNDTPTGIEGDLKARAVQCRNTRLEADHIFVLRESVAAQYLVPGLETDGAHVPAARDGSTNLPGCFVCGDITGKPYQIAKAVGEGNTAALSAVNYIDRLGRA